MSCYTKIKTEVLLANLLATNGKDSLYHYEEIQKIIQFLADTTPGYVTSDFSMKEIYYCIAEYPRLFCWINHNGQVFVGAGKNKPNLDYFNYGLSSEYSEHIKRLMMENPSVNTRQHTDIEMEIEEGYEQFTHQLLIN